MSQLSGRGEPTAVPTFARSGTRDIASTPQPTPTVIASAAIRPAIRWTACCPEPHWASRVRQPVWYGSPACSQAVLVMLFDCSPACVTQPPATCSTAAAVDSRPVEQRGLRGAEDLGRVQAGQRAAAPADRGANRLDDHRGPHTDHSPIASNAMRTCSIGVADVL